MSKDICGLVDNNRVLDVMRQKILPPADNLSQVESHRELS